jgi:hypothetical protein
MSCFPGIPPAIDRLAGVLFDLRNFSSRCPGEIGPRVEQIAFSIPAQRVRSVQFAWATMRSLPGPISTKGHTASALPPLASVLRIPGHEVLPGIFCCDDGHNEITDFKNPDVIELAKSTFGSIGNILMHAADDGHGNTIITDPHNSANTIMIDHVAVNQLHGSDFLLG